jgi:hypothetical protein
VVTLCLLPWGQAVKELLVSALALLRLASALNDHETLTREAKKGVLELLILLLHLWHALGLKGLVNLLRTHSWEPEASKHLLEEALRLRLGLLGLRHY